MNIGIVTTWFERGAAMVSRAYRDILAPHHRVFIYARGGEQYARRDPYWDQGSVTWARRVGGGQESEVNWSEFKRWVLGKQIDLLVFNEQRHWPTIILARRELPTVIGAYVDYYTSVTVPFFRLYDFLLCNTRRHYSVFCDHPHALYVPWGTDCRLFSGMCEPVAPGSVVFFHSAGMNFRRKGTAIALRAFHHLEGPCRLVLHTQVPVSTDSEVRELSQADDRVKVIEASVHAPGLYHLGDVYAYPTILEGIGLTVVEALACALPVVTTDAPPMNEFVQDGINGRLVRALEYRGRADGYYWAESRCSAEGIREAMRYYIDNRARLREFKQCARASAERNLDWSRNAGDLGARLESLTGSFERDEDLSELERQALRYSALRYSRRVLRTAFRRLGLDRLRVVESLVYR